MECPKCDGGTISFYGGCQHCGGTGEIGEGGLWRGSLCGYIVFAVYSDRGWTILTGEMRIIENEDFRPIARMEEVE